MKNIAQLQAMVDSLEEWIVIMYSLAITPHPYTRMDRYMLVIVDKKIDRLFHRLKKEVNSGAEIAHSYQQRAFRLRDKKMNQDAIASCIILNGIVNQTNALIIKFNSYLTLCRSHE